MSSTVTPNVVITPATQAAPAAQAKAPTLLQLPGIGVDLGCDPELFLVDAQGRIVGSERVLPPGYLDSNTTVVTTDGVQVELHPGAGSCREGLSARIYESLHELQNLVTAHNAQKPAAEAVSLNFNQVVRVRLSELRKLSQKSQHLGCGPSLSAYGTPPVEIDGMVYRKRSAAGHIHLGTQAFKQGYIDPVSYVRLADIIVANTCVLIEPDHKAARERRKHYGRAGEYRLPKHGLEYRTLSNFWLKAYPLMSFVMALSRQSLAVAHGPRAKQLKHTFTPGSYLLTAMEELFDAVPEALVQKAINKSDPEIAWRIFNESVRPILFNRISGYEGLNATNVADFVYFATAKPLDQWFSGTPMQSWATRGYGWEGFLRHTVNPLRVRDEAKVVKLPPRLPRWT